MYICNAFHDRTECVADGAKSVRRAGRVRKKRENVLWRRQGVRGKTRDGGSTRDQGRVRAGVYLAAAASAVIYLCRRRLALRKPMPADEEAVAAGTVTTQGGAVQVESIPRPDLTDARKRDDARQWWWRPPASGVPVNSSY